MRRILLSLLLLATPAVAQPVKPTSLEHVPAPGLSAGVKAPPLHVNSWVKGEPVKTYEEGKIYIVEFWATWCGPCIRGIPHLSEFQAEHKDVEVVSIAIWQREETQEQRNTVVTEFVESRETLAKDKDDPNLAMAYTVGVDQDRKTAAAWMDASGRMGIPSAFIVGRTGKVEWMGHPYSKGAMEEAYKAYVEGTWDREAFNKSYLEANAFAITRGRVREALREAEATNSTRLALMVIDRAITAFPTVTSFRIDKLSLLMTVGDNPVRAEAYARELTELEWNSPSTLNAIAWMMVDEPKVKKRNLDLALKCASRADTLENHQDANILDTLARVYWERGDHARAISIQEAAVERASVSMKSKMQETLQQYRETTPGA
ncbi:MAG: redoxin family protein [Phycisphaerales bacterium]|nr:redoxin family protein [Phycisphaerales bacterium]